MFVQDNLRKLKEIFDANFPNTKFFTMFIGAVIASVCLVAIASRATGVSEKADFAWVLLATGLQIAIGAGIGLRWFIRGRIFLNAPPSIGPNFA